jgi:phage antirepressor YoqD-like protein
MQLTTIGIPPTMSSLEMVDYINSQRGDGEAELRHDNFMAKVPQVLGVFAPKFLGTQTYGNNNTRAVYNFPKREACLMAMSYSYDLQAKVYDRMTALEADKAFKPPTTLSGALRLAADQAEQIEAQALLIEQQKPAVQFVERYTVADHGSKGFREVCKLLGANEARFKEFLTESKIMYRLGKNLTAHQNHIDAGRFEVKTGEANGYAYNRCLFTPKGVTWIAGEWAKYQLQSTSHTA